MNLITGATGLMGRAVMDEAQRANLPIAVMYRDAADAKKAPAGMATVIADYSDKESLRAAFTGMDVVYLVCSPIPQLVELENDAIDVCVEQGVRQVVLNSALGAEDFPKSFPSWHRKVEDRLKGSGLKYTILRPNSFMQNLLLSVAPTVRAQGAFYAAMADAKLSFIDVRDIAAAVTRVLQEPQAHAGKIYELNGPEALSYADVAKKVSQAAGRPVKYVDISETTQQKAMLEQGMPEWLVTALLDLQKYYTREGKGGDVTDMLSRLLGPTARTLDKFLEENKDKFVEQAAGA